MDDSEERQRIREQKRQELLDSADSSDEEGTPDNPVEVEGRDHLDTLVADTEVVLVDCYADWCGPCKMMEPAIETVAAESDALVAKVDVDSHQQLAGELGVQGVPTVVVYADGEPVDRRVGAQDQATLERLVEQAG
jgi:thioredoxin 1